MNLSKREQLYAIVTAAVLLAGIAYYFLLQPYFASRTKLTKDIKTAQTKFDREQRLLKAQPKVAADWKELLGGALKTVPAEAISQTHDAFYDAAYNARAYNDRFDLQTFNSDRPRQEGDFQVIRLNITCTGSTASLYRFVFALEQSSLPLRIEDMRVNSRHPGADDLNIALTISTLIFAPPTPAPSRSTSTPSPSRSTPAPIPQPQGGTL
ncbi:MAG: type II secretion system protein M [Phycisphaerales bacterium]|nr:type II secretion system protein M [Phycisphaerales bacterium]